MVVVALVALGVSVLNVVSVALGGETASAARSAKRLNRAPKAEIGTALRLARPLTIEAPTARAGIEYERGMRALAMLHIRPQEAFPGWTISFRKAQAGLLGVTLVPERRVEIYVRLDRPLTGLAHDLAHELGHVTDVMYNDDDARSQYLALRNRPGTTPWWTCSGCGDMEVGAGDFAETFAMWAAPRFRFYSVLAPVPTEEELQRFAALLPSTVTGQGSSAGFFNPSDADSNT